MKRHKPKGYPKGMKKLSSGHAGFKITTKKKVFNRETKESEHVTKSVFWAYHPTKGYRKNGQLGPRALKVLQKIVQKRLDK